MFLFWNYEKSSFCYKFSPPKKKKDSSYPATVFVATVDNVIPRSEKNSDSVEVFVLTVANKQEVPSSTCTKTEPECDADDWGVNLNWKGETKKKVPEPKFEPIIMKLQYGSPKYKVGHRMYLLLNMTPKI